MNAADKPSDVKALLQDYWFSNENTSEADDDPPFLDVYFTDDGLVHERDTENNPPVLKRFDESDELFQGINIDLNILNKGDGLDRESDINDSPPVLKRFDESDELVEVQFVFLKVIFG